MTNKVLPKDKTISKRRTFSWWYVAGGLIALCLLLSLTPGGQAMTAVAWGVASLALVIWLFRRYKLMRTILIVLLIVGVVAFVLAGGYAGLTHPK